MNSFEVNICNKIAEKVGDLGDDPRCFDYLPNYFMGGKTTELITKVLKLNSTYSSILTSVIVSSQGSKRKVEHQFAIFEMSKQIGFESGEDINRVITLCVAQALEIIPRAKCKGVEGYVDSSHYGICELDHKFSTKEE